MCLVAMRGGFQLCFSHLGQTKGQALAPLQSGAFAHHELAVGCFKEAEGFIYRRVAQST